MDKTPRSNISVTIRKDLAERLDREADLRMIGRSLIVEKAIEGFLEALPPVVLPSATAAEPGE